MTRYSIDKKIAFLLKMHGLSQADLSRMLGIKRSSINTWVKGKHVPSSRNIEKLSLIFEIKISWFRNDNAPTPPEEKYLFNGDSMKLSENEALPLGSGAIEPSNPSGPFPERDRQIKQNIKMINKSLYLVNNSDLQTVFNEIKESMGGKSTHEVSDFCGKMIRFLNKMKANKNIAVHPMGEEKGEVR